MIESPIAPVQNTARAIFHSLEREHVSKSHRKWVDVTIHPARRAGIDALFRFPPHLVQLINGQQGPVLLIGAELEPREPSGHPPLRGLYDFIRRQDK